MMVEFANGQLPWRKIKDKEQVSEGRTFDSDVLTDKIPSDSDSTGTSS